jgi:hypothetical protein
MCKSWLQRYDYCLTQIPFTVVDSTLFVVLSDGWRINSEKGIFPFYPGSILNMFYWV